MKRDMNLAREIMLAIESQETGCAPKELQLQGYTDDQIGYHTLLLLEAGLVEGKEIFSFDGGSPSAIATRITWNGHEFLDVARDKNRWKEALQIIQEKGGGAITIGLLIQVLASLAKRKLGLP